MTKHNGKARKAGTRVGSALISRNNRGGPIQTSAIFRHTTDTPAGQSVLERNDLTELMAMAELADRDFTAERTQIVVASGGAVDPVASERAEVERRAAEARHAHRLRLPRRPAWDARTTPEELDLQERNSFLAWRRDLADLEEEERLTLTPFEKNLDVWRQLWRVVERSDIVAQVVDARDPLLYFSSDLAAYARELHPSKASLVLLNKADLLPQHVRAAWADHFERNGLRYAFWSARAVTDALQELRSEAGELGVDVWELMRRRRQQQQEQDGAASGGEDFRTRVLDGEELAALLETAARDAVAEAGPEDSRNAVGGSDGGAARRAVVGLVGFPNVGKSSTINALFGTKKTSVAPTPGKTKHFQTLQIGDGLMLCDCPGLVMPRFAASKAEMVAAGVIPIDRLTDVRSPVDIVVARVGRANLEATYGLRLPQPAPHEPRDTPVTGEAAIRALAMLRGWTAGSGLPDESRAGRRFITDYCSGKLVHCRLPPRLDGSPGGAWVPDPSVASATGGSAAASTREATGTSGQASDTASQPAPANRAVDEADGVEGLTAAAGASSGSASIGGGGDGGGGFGTGAGARTKYTVAQQYSGAAPAGAPGGRAARGVAAGTSAPPARLDLDAADLELMDSMGIGADGKQRRPDYKFQKKPTRSKGNRGQSKGEGGFDGGALVTGKKGGLVRVAGH